MNIKDIQSLYNYNYWATGKILTAADGITAGEYIAPIPGLSFVTLRATLVHMLAAEQIWRRRCFEGVSPTSMLDEDDLPTPAELRALWIEEEKLMWAGLDTLTDDALQQTLSYHSTSGKEKQAELGQILSHLANHGTQHRAEAAVALTAVGRSPGDVDMISYFLSR